MCKINEILEVTVRSIHLDVRTLIAVFGSQNIS